jgi:hypothetical protein
VRDNAFLAWQPLVNHFIRELSSIFAPAVSRIRRLMDTWNPYDNNVPEPLRLTSLPNTIERYMTEESVQATSDGSHLTAVKSVKEKTSKTKTTGQWWTSIAHSAAPMDMNTLNVILWQN